MTSSFQSTAFRSSASPVDTFVAQPTVLPKTGAEELAEILQIVNPALQQFIGQRIQKEVEKDKAQATADVLEAEINGGAISRLSNNLEKSEERQTVREVIGGSRVYKRQYEKAIVALQAQKRGNRLQRDYDVAKINTGELDSSGQPIFKFLKEYSTDSDEYKNWRKSYLDEDLETFTRLGIDPNVVSQFYIPEMAKELFEVTDYGTKQNRSFEYNKFLGLMPEVLNQASQALSKGEEDKASVILNGYLENMYKGGITGTDATKTYTTLIDNVYALGEKLVDVDITKPDAANKLALAEDFPDKILSLVKYGDKDLRSHKDYLTKSAAFSSKFETLVMQRLKYKNEVEPALNKLEIKNRFKALNNIPLTVDMTDEQKDTAIINKRNAYEALKNDSKFTTKEEQDYIDQLGKSDNFNLKSKLIPQLENKIRLGIFDGLDQELEKAISDIENNHATMDNEAITLIDDLKTFAANSDGLAEDIESTTTNIMTTINNTLQTSDTAFAAGFGIQKNLKTATKLNIEVQDKVKKYFTDYIKTNKRRPSSLEVQEIEKQYGIMALAAEGNQEFVDLKNKLYKDIFNPFVKAAEFSAKTYKEKIEGVNLQNTVPEGSFGIGTVENERTRQLQQQNTNTNNNNFFEGGMDLSSVPQFERRRGAGYGGGMPVEFDLQGLLNQENFPDFGGLAELVRGGESLGSGLYNAFNGGTTDTAGEMDITSKTIGEMEQMQADGEVFAVGAYQFTPNVLTEARVYSGLSKDDIMTPENQDRLFWGMLLSGRKRPSLAAYLTGQSDDLNAAHEDLALEFAAIQGPDGKGMYDNDKAGNFARIDANLVREALINARNLLINR
tara:strand:- start:703 stop:3225 length:2523 start_codon:yes stop_codon:yes gene_type:complete